MTDFSAPAAPQNANTADTPTAATVLHAAPDASADLRELLGWLDDCHQHYHDELAAALHDRLGSSLTALAMRLALIERQAGADPKLAGQWAKANSQLAAISATARQVQKQLRPVALEVLGLQPALADYLLQFGLRNTMTCTLAFDDLGQPVPMDKAAVLFRVIQQGLANIEHHSRARNVKLTVRRIDGELEVDLQDDGIGFDPPTTLQKQTHGLRLMRERAALLGLQVQIDSAPGCGCRITLRNGVPT